MVIQIILLSFRHKHLTQRWLILPSVAKLLYFSFGKALIYSVKPFVQNFCSRLLSNLFFYLSVLYNGKYVSNTFWKSIKQKFPGFPLL